MTMVHYPMEKLSIVSKALLAFMPDISCVEVLLNREQLSLLVNQLSIVGTNTKCTSSGLYSCKKLCTCYTECALAVSKERTANVRVCNSQ